MGISAMVAVEKLLVLRAMSVELFFSSGHRLEQDF